MKRWLKMMGWIVGVAALVSGCDDAARSSPASPAPTVPTAKAAQPDEPALPTSLPQLDQAGFDKLIRETAQSHRILVIDFWATWCEPCVQMFPALHESAASLGPGVRLVSVTLDAPGQYERSAIQFLAKNHAFADAYMMQADADERLKISAALSPNWKGLVVPAILVYDRDGRPAGEYLGDGRAGPIISRVQELLASQPKP